jgi:hypothetical protein
MSAAPDFSKFRVPLGSLVVDASLVLALIWWGATMTQRLEEMSRRIQTVEQVKIQPEADRRIAVIEARLVDQTTRLQSIEDKLDRALDRGR